MLLRNLNQGRAPTPVVDHARLGLPRELWPVGWRLWREDKFDGSTGTIFNRWLWVREKFYVDKAASVGVDPISLLPGGGMRLTAYATEHSRTGKIVPVGTQLMSGWLGWQDEFGRNADWSLSGAERENSGRDAVRAQHYRPPFLMTLRCRISQTDTVRLNGSWMMQERHRRFELPWTDHKNDPDAGIVIELDTDEAYPHWGLMPQNMHFWTQHSTEIDPAVFTHGLGNPQLPWVWDRWYDVTVLVDTDGGDGAIAGHTGQRLLATVVDGHLHTRRPADVPQPRREYVEDTWNAPYNMTIVFTPPRNPEATSKLKARCQSTQTEKRTCRAVLLIMTLHLCACAP